MTWSSSETHRMRGATCCANVSAGNATKMKKSNKQLLTKEDLLNWITEMAGKRSSFGKTLLITAGAGDIDVLLKPMKEIIES